LIMLVGGTNCSVADDELETFSNGQYNDPFDGTFPWQLVDDEGTNENLSVSFLVPDLTGDGAADLLQHNLTYIEMNQTFSTEISAISGSDGALMWSRSLPGAMAYAFPVKDLNNDGQHDVVLDLVLQISSIPKSRLIALSGSDGCQLWSHDEFLAATLAYPVDDCTGDNVTDLIAHIFAPYFNGSISTQICTLDGLNGTRINTRTFLDSLALEYPSGNLTDDGQEDRLRVAYSLHDRSSFPLAEGDGELAVNSSLTAMDSTSQIELWTFNSTSPLMAMPVSDLTADGLDDVLLYRLNQTDGGLDILLLEGSSGRDYWCRSYSGMVLALPTVDLTGDGLSDLLIYVLGDESDTLTAAIQAVSGREGRLLWQSSGPIISGFW